MMDLHLFKCTQGIAVLSCIIFSFAMYPKSYRKEKGTLTDVGFDSRLRKLPDQGKIRVQ